MVRVDVAEDAAGVGGGDKELGLGKVREGRDLGGELGVGGDEGLVGAQRGDY